MTLSLTEPFPKEDVCGQKHSHHSMASTVQIGPQSLEESKYVKKIKFMCIPSSIEVHQTHLLKENVAHKVKVIYTMPTTTMALPYLKKFEQIVKY